EDHRALGKRLCDDLGAVGGAVVDEQQLVGRAGVGEHAANRVLEVLGPVVDRHQHAHHALALAHAPRSTSHAASTTTGAARATPPGAGSIVGPITSSSATGRHGTRSRPSSSSTAAHTANRP